MRTVFIKSTWREDVVFSELTKALFTMAPRRGGKSKRAYYEMYDDPVVFLEDYGFKKEELYDLYTEELTKKKDPSEAILEVFNKISSIPIYKPTTNENNSSTAIPNIIMARKSIPNTPEGLLF